MNLLPRLGCGTTLSLLLVTPALAEFTATNRPFPGIAWYAETRRDPPNRLFVAEVDLSQPGLKVRVARGGPDPDGPGPWQTTLLQPTRIATRERFDLVTNGDFFRVRSLAEGETNGPGYRTHVWSRVTGPAASRCEAWSTPRDSKPCVVVGKNGSVGIKLLSDPGADHCEVVAGNTLLLEGGRRVAPDNPTRHPRTVVGLDAARTTLVILVVDGRKPGVAAGMNYAELAEEMVRLGCHDALNLDGGGSSLLAVRDAAEGDYDILNQPTDGRERAVANVLGIAVAPSASSGATAP